MRRPPPKRRESKADTDGPVWLYGRHAVLAALKTKQRHQHQLLCTKNGLDWLSDHGFDIPIDPVKPDIIDGALPAGAVHQGIALRANPLPPARLSTIDAASGRPVLVLDQVTDPQNIGALFRIAAAFDVQAIVAQDRRTPPLAGALAKAAVGAVEYVPFVPVVNIARSLSHLTEAGFLTLGLAGEAETRLPEVRPERPVALVLGAEGAGLRTLVRETCEGLIRIPMSDRVESLNVATAGGIALYALTQGN